MGWIELLMALLSFFAAKANGATNTQAALVGAAAGLGTYYVKNHTDWGKANLGALDGSWTPLLDGKGQQVLDREGKVVYVPGTAVPDLNPDGSVKRDVNGGIVYKVFDTTADVLKSWGGTGTAAVVGTAAVATNGDLQKYLPWLLIGGAFLLLSR